jgi:hypothetical protein
MTEAEWQGGADPAAMLGRLQGRASDRKLRLLACACVRRSPLLTGMLQADYRRRLREAVESAERAAEGRGAAERLAEAYAAAAGCVAGEAYFEQPAAQAAQDTAREGAADAAQAVFQALEQQARRHGAESSPFVANEADDVAAALAEERRRQADAVRELFGNPFRPVPLTPGLRRWNDGCVVKMARVIYDERRYADLPILADALEEAGCEHRGLLEHCRGDGHALGCWALDLLLGQG